MTLRHRRDATSMAWRCGSYTTRFSHQSTRHRSIHASLDGVNNHNVMLFDLNSCALENFECHYNKYCAQQDLKPFLKEELQAELASRFDCKFKRVRISASIKLSRRACHRRDAGSTA